MLGGIIAAATSAIGSQIQGIEARDAEDRAYTKQKELMQDQYGYNNKMAEENQRRAKEMWNYTNFENQKQHLLDANLSPGLFYSGSGAGGASTSGGQGQGIGLGTETGVGYGIQEKALGLQLANAASQIALNESQANKNNAEAEKIAGVDTEAVKVSTELNKRIKDLQDTIERVMNSQEQLNAANYFKVQAEERRMWEQLRSDIVKANVDEATANEQINAVGLANWNSILTGIERISKTKLNEQQIEKLKNDMAVAWANVSLGEAAVSNQADKIANDLLVNIKGLDLREQELLKDWIYEGVHAGKEISGEIMNWLSRGIGKNVTTVAGRIEKMFNGKGQQIGSKSIQETIKKAIE